MYVCIYVYAQVCMIDSRTSCSGCCFCWWSLFLVDPISASVCVIVVFFMVNFLCGWSVRRDAREMKKGLCGWLCCDDCVSARSHSEVASQLFVVLSGFLRYQCIQQQSASSHNVCLFVRSFVSCHRHRWRMSIVCLCHVCCVWALRSTKYNITERYNFKVSARENTKPRCSMGWDWWYELVGIIK